MRADLAAFSTPSLDSTLPRAPVAQFHAGVAAAFLRAQAHLPRHTRAYQIGDGVVRMDFAGDALISPFTRALEHLRVSPDLAPDLTIGLWEMASSGVALAPPPWTEDAYRPRGEIVGFQDDAHITAYEPEGRIVFTYNVPAAQAHIAVLNHTSLPGRELAAPLRMLLPAFLETRGIQYLHAAAVGLPDGGVLLAGKSGQGKSTTALACLASELFFAGDDYCAARFEGAPTVYSIYSSGKALGSTLSLLPFLDPLIANRATMQHDKAIWYFHEQASGRLIQQFPLRAILLPHITAQHDTTLAPASPQAALVALAPTTTSQIPNAGHAVVQRIAALSRRVPVYRLNVGSDMSQIPQTILRVLDEHRT